MAAPAGLHWNLTVRNPYSPERLGGAHMQRIVDRLTKLVNQVVQPFPLLLKGHVQPFGSTSGTVPSHSPSARSRL